MFLGVISYSFASAYLWGFCLTRQGSFEITLRLQNAVSSRMS